MTHLIRTFFLLFIFTMTALRAAAGEYCSQKKLAFASYSEKASQELETYKRQLRFANRQSSILEKQRKAGVKQKFKDRTIRLIQGHLQAARKSLKKYKRLKGSKQTVAKQLKNCKSREKFLETKRLRDHAKEEYIEQLPTPSPEPITQPNYEDTPVIQSVTVPAEY